MAKMGEKMINRIEKIKIKNNFDVIFGLTITSGIHFTPFYSFRSWNFIHWELFV